MRRPRVATFAGEHAARQSTQVSTGRARFERRIGAWPAAQRVRMLTCMLSSKRVSPACRKHRMPSRRRQRRPPGRAPDSRCSGSTRPRCTATVPRRRDFPRPSAVGSSSWRSSEPASTPTGRATARARRHRPSSASCRRLPGLDRRCSKRIAPSISARPRRWGTALDRQAFGHICGCGFARLATRSAHRRTRGFGGLAGDERPDVDDAAGLPVAEEVDLDVRADGRRARSGGRRRRSRPCDV